MDRPPAIPAGWTPATWAARLRYLAAACRPDHPAAAAAYDDQAAALERIAAAIDDDERRTFARVSQCRKSGPMTKSRR
jgi:hypothetical protein